MSKQYYALYVNDPAGADARWPEDAPFTEGQLRSIGEVDSDWEANSPEFGEQGVDFGLTEPQRPFITVIPIDEPSDDEEWNSDSHSFEARALRPHPLNTKYDNASTVTQKLDVIAKSLGLTD